MMTRFLMAGLLAVFAAGPSWAGPQSLQQNSFATWKAEDNCVHQAFRQFPDYTPESNAKRNEAMRQCLDRGQLPPRADLTPPQPPRDSSGSSTPRR